MKGLELEAEQNNRLLDDPKNGSAAGDFLLNGSADY